jgi:hypothetical protein
MGGPKDTGPASDRADARGLLKELHQRLQEFLDDSTRAQQSNTTGDVLLFRESQDRRRSKSNILPFRKRRAGDRAY